MSANYENLTKAEREKILNDVYELAYDYEKEYGNCIQCTLAAIKDTFGIIDDNVFKAAHGLAAGIGLRSTGVCGALSAGVMVVSVLEGREWEKIADGEKPYSYKLSRKLLDRFEEDYGSILCHQIQEKIMGRSYDLSIEGESQAYLDAGGRIDKCTSVVGNGAKYIAEMILDGDLKV